MLIYRRTTWRRSNVVIPNLNPSVNDLGKVKNRYLSLILKRSHARKAVDILFAISKRTHWKSIRLACFCLIVALHVGCWCDPRR